MPEIIYREDEVILSKDFFSNYSIWEIGKSIERGNKAYREGAIET